MLCEQSDYTNPYTNIKQSIRLNKRSQSASLFKALSIDKVRDTVDRNILALYSRIFTTESLAPRLVRHLLSRCIVYHCLWCSGAWILLNITVSMGVLSNIRTFGSNDIPFSNHPRLDDHAVSIRHLLFTDNFIKPYSHEYILAHLLAIYCIPMFLL